MSEDQMYDELDESESQKPDSLDSESFQDDIVDDFDDLMDEGFSVVAGLDSDYSESLNDDLYDEDFTLYA